MSHGGNARVKALLWRFLYKFLTLGLGGLRIDHVSAYDRSAGIVWKADISHSAEPRRRHRQGRSPVLRIEDNAGGGRQVRLNNLPGFNRTGIVSIGRDPVWANVILNSNRVSRKHCILRIRGNRAELKDEGADGTGSTWGTLLHGQRLRPGIWVDIGNADHFHVADVKISIR